jgi:secreted trypsin-like serine protease
MTPSLTKDWLDTGPPGRGLVARSVLASTLGLLLLFVGLLTAGPAQAKGDPAVTPKVIGGGIAPEGAWPSQAAILSSGVANPYNAQFCGGTLIDQFWVLTAAHCVTDDEGNVAPASAVEVAIGINDLTEIDAGDRIDVEAIRVIPEWDPVDFDWDFALLELAAPSTQPTTELIGPGQESLTAAGELGAVAGWGCSGTTACEVYPELLQEADVTFVADADCSSPFSYGSGFDSTSMICAGDFVDGLPDTCAGDSGGPLVAFGPGDTPLLAGITSWGNSCALPLYPGVYSRVLAGREWIDETIAGNARLDVSKTGVGQGSITSDPAGIDCGTTCSGYFSDGVTVTLTATPASGSTFTGWGGDCSGTDTCEVTMDSIHQVSADFTRAAPTVSLTARPAKRASRRVATFRFRSSQSGSTFRCRLNGKSWGKCSSPKTYRNLKRGRKHAFRVRATTDGLTGPIKLYRWYVKRR